MMRIDQNLGRLDAQSRLSVSQSHLNKSIEKLVSGLRINSASSSDVISLAVAKKRFEVEKAAAPQKHVQDTTTKLMIAEGGLNETQSMLNRMKELALHASSDFSTDSDRTSLQEELNNLKKEITKIGDVAQFNGENLLDGSSPIVTQTINFGGQDRFLELGDMRSEGLGIADLSISSKTDAAAALSKIDEAMSTVSDKRSSIGEEMTRSSEMLSNLQLRPKSLEDPTPTTQVSRIDREAVIEAMMKEFEESRQKFDSIRNQIYQNQDPLKAIQLLWG